LIAIRSCRASEMMKPADGADMLGKRFEIGRQFCEAPREVSVEIWVRRNSLMHHSFHRRF